MTNLQEKNDRIEIIIGLAAGLGTNFQTVVDAIKSQLEGTAKVVHIKVTDLMFTFAKERDIQVDGMPEDFLSNDKTYQKSIRTFLKMQLGSRLCLDQKRSDFIGLLCIAEIAKYRASNLCENLVFFIIDSLKRPEESELLNEVYGRNFIQLSVFESEQNRIKNLLTDYKSDQGWKDLKRTVLDLDMSLSNNHSSALFLVRKDEKDNDQKLKNGNSSFGQRSFETFYRAHFFISMNSNLSAKSQIARFLEILLGNPFCQPTFDEYGMFHAESAALRSLDLSRQVGAVVMDEDGAIIAMGYNEVHKKSAALQQPEDESHFDYSKGIENNLATKQAALAQLIKQIRTNVSDINEQSIDQIAQEIKNSEFWDATEYFRSIHAEMAAIINAARRGISTKNCTLYVNTFPCHTCTKHIIASGIKRVVYLHPYPKSRSHQMFGDFIERDSKIPSPSKVSFDPFFGIAPSRYLYVFKQPPGSRQEYGKVKIWSLVTGRPRYLIRRNPLTYIDRELAVLSAHIDFFGEAIKKLESLDKADLQQSWQTEFKSN